MLCPDCHNFVSASAKSCPKCGCRINNQKLMDRIFALIAIFIGFVGGNITPELGIIAFVFILCGMIWFCKSFVGKSPI